MSNQPAAKRIRLDNDETCHWKCTFCSKAFFTNKKFNDHKNKTGHMVEDVFDEVHAEVDAEEEDLENGTWASV